MSARWTARHRIVKIAAVTALSAVLVVGCTSNTAAPAESSSAPAAASSSAAGSAAATAAGGGNDAPGEKVVIGFSAPAADHGWMGAITKAAVAEAEGYPDVELRQAEATNDVNLQISQIETFINDGVDAIDCGVNPVAAEQVSLRPVHTGVADVIASAEGAHFVAGLGRFTDQSVSESSGRAGDENVTGHR